MAGLIVICFFVLAWTLAMGGLAFAEANYLGAAGDLVLAVLMGWVIWNLIVVARNRRKFMRHFRSMYP